MLNWFNTKEETAFGETLAEFIDQRLREIGKSGSQKQGDKHQTLISQVLLQAQQFRDSHRLNAYKKAKLGNAFKWKMKDLGHSDELIDQLTKDLLIVLHKG